eukprot:m.153819 g.153819  ORF g.153819 m.153819 type:complete len:413 (+) comp30852_c0_seq1:185-1423(+)
MTSTPLQLIGCEHSLFSGKIRGYLRWKGVPFEEVLPTAEVYVDVILPRVGWAVIPVLCVPHEDQRYSFVQDTSDIIDEVERLYPHPPVMPQSSLESRLVCHLIELLADQWLVLPAMYYRWCFPQQRDFLVSEWGGALFPHLPHAERSSQAKQSMARFEKIAEILGATPELFQPIEESFETLLDLLTKHLETHDYLLGNTPTLADFSMMGPLYAHLYRDPVPGYRMRIRAPLVVQWIERVMGLNAAALSQRTINSECEIVGVTTVVDANADGVDGIPITLIAVVQHMLEEYEPVLHHTAETFAKTNFPIDTLVPRALGMASFTLGGVVGQRLVNPFDLWMAQRFFDAAATNVSRSHAWISASFGTTGSKLLGLASMFTPHTGACRVKRYENKLYTGTASHMGYSEYRGVHAKL